MSQSNNFHITAKIHAIISVFYALIVTTAQAQNPSPPLPASFEGQVSAEQRVSYDDVYSIELTLPVSGDVEVSAAEADEIVIKLEKSGKGNDEPSVTAYLDAVTLTTSKVDDILQLTLELPDTPPKVELTGINCFIETPSDVDLRIGTTEGNIRVNGIRGDMELATEAGNVQLDKTTGSYQVNIRQGRVYGEILLTRGDNTLKTESGDINLVVLDALSAPMEMTAMDGGITLRLPKDFPADLELKTENEERRAITIDLPIEIEKGFVGDAMKGWLNGGGPLLRLTASNQITLLELEQKAEPETDAPETAEGAYWQQSVPKAVERPIIDGVLLEKAWSTAVPLHPFYKSNGEEYADEQTSAFLMWDDVHLYIGIKAYDSNITDLRVSKTTKDSAVWEDDALEILVDPNPETAVYYDLIINPLGAVFDQVVQSDYPVDSRFMPLHSEMPRTEEPPPKSVADAAWDSMAQIRTQVEAHFWSVEIALPRAVLEPESAGNWRLNLHRKAPNHNEYSYWLPTYDTGSPWWPHWLEQMGELRFIEKNATAGIEPEELFELTSVEISGNSDIPTPEILKRLPFHSGDIITISQLSWLKAELADDGWFIEAELETSTTPSDSATPEADAPLNGSAKTPPVLQPGEFRDAAFRVTLHLRVTELPTRNVTGFDLRRNTRFRSETLREKFWLQSGRIPLRTLHIKTQLISTLYRNNGYTLAKVESQFFDDYLLIDIDEGHLDEIRFVGNKKIERETLIEALGLQTGEVYNQSKGELRVEVMKSILSSKNPYFKAIEYWEVKREADKNVMVVEIQERSLLNWNLTPHIDFNRVHGLVLGGNGEISTDQSNSTRVFGAVTNGLSSDIWNYQAGIEKNWFERYKSTIGGSYYKRTHTIYDATISVQEEFLAASVFGISTLDYYQREGFQVWVTQQLAPSFGITLEYTADEHQNLLKSTDWSLFNREFPKPSNKRIDRGRLRAFSTIYWFDNRDRKSQSKRFFRETLSPNAGATRGWRGYFAVEYADEDFGGDFVFNRYHFQVSRYNRLAARHNLDFRLWGSFADAPLPRQRLFYLGGPSTLRGYDLNESVGNNLLLLNVEYRLHLNQSSDTEGGTLRTVLSAFLDVGDVWFDEENFVLDDLKASVGVGFSVISEVSAVSDTPSVFRVEVARALRKGRDVQVLLRLARMF